MKKYRRMTLAAALILALILALTLSACVDDQIDDQMLDGDGYEKPRPDAYDLILSQYQTALSEGWDRDTLTAHGLNMLVADAHHGTPLEDIGYAVEDLDHNGYPELVIGSMVEDEFFGCLIFDLYTLDADTEAQPLFISGERNRLYYAGEDLFAQVGANSAFDSINTTRQLADGALTDLQTETPASDYQQPSLTPLAYWPQ